MIDLHCHLLPGIDDGCADMQTTLEMAREYLKHDVSRLVVTPHVRSGMFDNNEGDIRELVVETRQKLNEQNINLDIRPGAEYYWDENFLRKCMDHQNLLTLGDYGKHVLVEFNYLTKPLNLREVVFDLKVKGITLVMAHPERYKFVGEDLDFVEDLINAGMLLQGTLGPLAGIWGSRSKSLLKKLLKKDLIHLISSDSHSPKNVSKYINGTKDKLIDWIGEAETKRLLVTNPEKIFMGQSV